MLNMRLASAFNMWWQAVLDRRDSSITVESVIARIRNRGLLQVWGCVGRETWEREGPEGIHKAIISEVVIHKVKGSQQP